VWSVELGKVGGETAGKNAANNLPMKILDEENLGRGGKKKPEVMMVNVQP